jgi:hypothetical protein
VECAEQVTGLLQVFPADLPEQAVVIRIGWQGRRGLLRFASGYYCEEKNEEVLFH